MPRLSPLVRVKAVRDADRECQDERHHADEAGAAAVAVLVSAVSGVEGEPAPVPFLRADEVALGGEVVDHLAEMGIAPVGHVERRSGIRSRNVARAAGGLARHRAGPPAEQSRRSPRRTGPPGGAAPGRSAAGAADRAWPSEAWRFRLGCCGAARREAAAAVDGSFDVRLGVAADSPPAYERLRERPLDQILGCLGVAGERVRHPEQGRRAAHHEVAELGIDVRVHDHPMCWDRRESEGSARALLPESRDRSGSHPPSRAASGPGVGPRHSTMSAGGCHRWMHDTVQGLQGYDDDRVYLESVTSSAHTSIRSLSTHAACMTCPVRRRTTVPVATSTRPGLAQSSACHNHIRAVG